MDIIRRSAQVRVNIWVGTKMRSRPIRAPTLILEAGFDAGKPSPITQGYNFASDRVTTLSVEFIPIKYVNNFNQIWRGRVITLRKRSTDKSSMNSNTPVPTPGYCV